MADDIKPRAKVLIVRGEKVIAEMGPGSGFPKNPDGSPATQQQFEEFMGLFTEQGYPWLGITAGRVPHEEKGDRIVILTNEAELEKQRAQRASQQAAEDFVTGIRDLVESGSVTFSD